MNQSHLNFLCKKFKLGSAIELPLQIYGSRGGSHIWRIQTEKNNYVIKQLAPVIDLTNPKIIVKYELSEEIAYRFSQQDIPAIFAIEESNHRLIILDNIGYLIYPWINGHTLKQNEISEAHAIKIAEITAKIHAINLSVPEIGTPRFDIHSNDSIVNAIEKAISFKCSFANTLKEKQNFLLNLNETYQKAIPTLKEHSVVTHGDIDPLNVVWNTQDQPNLIDWESAKRMNPTQEIVRTSLRFSGGGDNFSSLIYANMLDTYKRSGGLFNKNHVEAAVHGLSGGTINWLLYNIELACTSHSSEEKIVACKEVESILNININRSQPIITQLIKIT